MRKTRMSDTENRVTVCAETLAKMLDCGRSTAVKIGTEAGARVQIGKRVLFKLDKVDKYLENMAGG